MQTPANQLSEGAKAPSRPLPLPSAFFLIPAAASLLLFLLFAFVKAGFGDAPLFCLGCLVLLYLVADWKLHRSVLATSASTDPIKPWMPVFFTLAGGIFAPTLLGMALSQLSRLLSRVYDLVGDVLPNALPIASSASELIDNYGIFLAVAVASALGVCFQWRMVSAIREFLQSKQRTLGKHRSAVAAAALGIALTAPGCLWLLSDNGIVLQFAMQYEWESMVVLAGFASGCLGFLILGWLSAQVSATQTA